MLTLLIFMLGFNLNLNKHPSILTLILNLNSSTKEEEDKLKRNIISTVALVQLGIHR